MGFLDALKLLREIGIEKAAKITSFLAWMVLPFWIWWVILQVVGVQAFSLSFAIPGLFLLFITLVFVVCQAYFWRNHEFKVMKLFEKAGAIFKNPENSQTAEEFKDECRKFILPFTHHMPFFLSAISGTRTNLGRSVIGFIQASYVSYSTVAVVVVFRGEVKEFVDFLSTYLPSGLSSEWASWIARNYWISLVVLWIVSLYYDPSVSLLRRSKALSSSKSDFLLHYFVILGDLTTRIGLLLSYVFEIPVALAEKERAFFTDPFIDPQTLPTIVQRAMSNVEGKSCDVSRWDQDIASEADAERVRELARKDPRTPFILRLFAMQSKSKDLLERIRQTQPMTYLGTHNDRCVFLGHVVYNPVKKIRQGRFYFDTTYLKKEFLLIYRNQAEKQRQIEMKLPSQLEELIKSLG